MLLQQEREQVVQYGRKLLERGLTTGTGGNVSVCNRERGLVALSPSSMDYFEITPEDVVVLEMDGTVASGARRPSSELDMHLEVYRRRPDTAAVVHTHSLYATAVACMGWDLEPVHYLVAFAGERVRCARYATYGTPELAENAMAALGKRGACLLANHGLLTCGATVESAFSTAEHLEYVAKLLCVTRSMGEPQILDVEEMRRVMDKFGTNPYK